MALDQSYHRLWFYSGNQYQGGHRWKGCLRLVSGQSLPEEIAEECESRGVDPFGLFCQCAREYKTLDNPTYPIGTRFLLNAKLNDRESGKLFFTSPHTESPIEVEKPS